MSEILEEQIQVSTPHKSKNSANLWAALIFIIVTVVFVVYIEPMVDEPEANNEEVIEEEIVEIIDEPQITNFATIQQANWKDFEKAQTDIQKLTKGQTIIGEILADPADEDVFYFAASAYDQHLQQNLVSIYKYNVANYSFERLYRTTYARGGTILLGPEAIAEFQVLGYDNQQLIILVKNREAKMDDSVNLWQLGLERSDDYNLVSMNLLRPYAGFDEYGNE